ncbi:Sister Chromatid Cohesion Protein Pds5 B [Manis pentadactyla]|nr:Sister Chromatid Cohesion Protein Pds5 B [Manis pentadactyla]
MLPAPRRGESVRMPRVCGGGDPREPGVGSGRRVLGGGGAACARAQKGLRGTVRPAEEKPRGERRMWYEMPGLKSHSR